jgi:hypothetical protein
MVMMVAMSQQQQQQQQQQRGARLQMLAKTQMMKKMQNS